MLDSPSDSREAAEAARDIDLDEIQHKLKRLHAELGARQKVHPSTGNGDGSEAAPTEPGSDR